MTSLGKRACVCMYRNSYMVYETNADYFGGWSARALSEQPGTVFSGDLQHPVEPEQC